MALVTPSGSAVERRILALIEPSLSDMGFAVVRVTLSGSQRRRLQVMAEHADGRTMGVDDCAEISSVISALLDVEDPIDGEYVLEVSSPGIDRPLTRPLDFERFAGHEARVELAMPLDGQRRFRGRLLGLDGERENVRLALAAGDEVALPLASVSKAKLVLTDELIARHRPH